MLQENKHNGFVFLKNGKLVNEKENGLKGWYKVSKENISVAISNGDFYEPKVEI